LTRASSGHAKHQGFIVLATLKPRVSNRTLTWRLTRVAARTISGVLSQEPPRATRKIGSPLAIHADPSVGAPPWDVLQDEATKAESVSGLPMFGDRFPA
jgi:hypothetical protein